MSGNNSNGNMSRPNTSGKVATTIKGPVPMHFRLKTGQDVLKEPQGRPISKKGTAGK